MYQVCTALKDSPPCGEESLTELRAIPVVRLSRHSVISWVYTVNLVSICGKAHNRGGSQRSGPEMESYLFAPPPDRRLLPWPPPPTLPTGPALPRHLETIIRPALSFLTIKRRRSPTFYLRLRAIPWDQGGGGSRDQCWKKKGPWGRGRRMVLSQVHELDMLSLNSWDLGFREGP